MAAGPAQLHDLGQNLHALLAGAASSAWASRSMRLLAQGLVEGRFAGAQFHPQR